MGTPRYKDLTDMRFTKLIARKYIGTRKKGLSAWALWECDCDCGNKHTVTATSLLTGSIRSCGCLHKETMHRVNALEVGEAAFNAYYKDIQRRAQTRGLLFSLTKEEVKHISKQPCTYCGDLPSMSKVNRGGNGAFVYNGVDRVDNAIGYTIANSAPCCKVCNQMKSDRSDTEFRDRVRRIYHNLSLGRW